jgi:hypothetical protein
MKITQHFAEKLSIELVSERRKKLNQDIENLRQKIQEDCIKDTPKEILECCQKYPEYFTYTISLYRNNSYFNINAVLKPGSANREYYDQKLDKYSEEIQRIGRERTELDSLLYKLRDVLYGLRTKSRIVEQFPELESFFKTEENTPKVREMNFSIIKKAAILKAQLSGV